MCGCFVGWRQGWSSLCPCVDEVSTHYVESDITTVMHSFILLKPDVSQVTLEVEIIVYNDSKETDW